MGNIINCAREYIKSDDEKKDLEQILNDKNSDKEMALLAEKELTDLKQKKMRGAWLEPCKLNHVTHTEALISGVTPR